MQSDRTSVIGERSFSLVQRVFTLSTTEVRIPVPRILVDPSGEILYALRKVQTDSWIAYQLYHCYPRALDSGSRHGLPRILCSPDIPHDP
jgi:hypothetical protein